MSPCTAIVLSYDRNAALARHMVACYDELWPGHPFTFRIPFQDRAAVEDHPRCEFVAAPPDIKGTVAALLDGLADDAWVYWCIDDKYPVLLDLARVEPLVAALGRGVPAEVSGILFCRARRMLDPACLTDERLTLGGERLIGRRAYHQIWVHQYLRVKVLRGLFGRFSDVIPTARAMDAMKDALAKPSDHALFVTCDSLAAFGESATEGVLTENCLESMARRGIPVPAWQPSVAASPKHIGMQEPGGRR